jgi:hypothetical protein
MTDRGRKYQTFNKELKTKTEINREYYFKYIRGRMNDNKYEPQFTHIDEDLFWELSIEEVNIYFFGK